MAVDSVMIEAEGVCVDTGGGDELIYTISIEVICSVKASAYDVKTVKLLTNTLEDLLDFFQIAKVATFPLNLCICLFFLDVLDTFCALLFLSVDHDHMAAL